ncbi:MAG: glycosyltransferase family 2 protein [Planctomycetota bacterium]
MAFTVGGKNHTGTDKPSPVEPKGQIWKEGDITADPASAIIKTMPRISAIILTMNQRDRTIQCLSQLSAIKDPPFNILLWDNGSSDGTLKAVQEEFPEVSVHRHADNLGVASGRNAAADLAIREFNPHYLLFLDNDMLVEPGFVGALLKPFSDKEQVGQTQAKLRFMDDRALLNDGGGARINFVLWKITPVGYNEVDQGQYDTTKKCISCGGAMMVRADVFQKLGGFDSQFDPFGPEDLDFSLRLQKSGYDALYVPKAVAYHAVSHTFGEGYSEEYARHKVHHWFLFMRRHASPIQKFGFYLFGAPYLFFQVAIREARKGNLTALRGLMRGVFDYLKSSVGKGI